MTYQVDNQANIENITDPAGGDTFHYDNLDRLTKIETGALDVAAYSYDASGDRLSKKIETGTPQIYSYGLNHRLNAVDTVSRHYDLNGNTTQIGTDNYYNYDGQKNKFVEFHC